LLLFFKFIQKTGATFPSNFTIMKIEQIQATQIKELIENKELTSEQQKLRKEIINDFLGRYRKKPLYSHPIEPGALTAFLKILLKTEGIEIKETTAGTG